MVKFTVTSFDSAHHWLFGLCSESVSAGSSENFSFERHELLRKAVAGSNPASDESRCSSMAEHYSGRSFPLQEIVLVKAGVPSETESGRAYAVR